MPILRASAVVRSASVFAVTSCAVRSPPGAVAAARIAFAVAGTSSPRPGFEGTMLDRRRRRRRSARPSAGGRPSSTSFPKYASASVAADAQVGATAARAGRASGRSASAAAASASGRMRAGRAPTRRVAPAAARAGASATRIVRRRRPHGQADRRALERRERTDDRPLRGLPVEHAAGAAPGRRRSSARGARARPRAAAGRSSTRAGRARAAARRPRPRRAAAGSGRRSGRAGACSRGTGPKPSPSRRAASTAAAKSGWIPSETGMTRKVRSPTVNSTGVRWTSSKRFSSSRRACFGVSPPTSMPAMRTPSASLADEPAKTMPSATAAPSSTTSAPSSQDQRNEAARRRRRRMPITSVPAGGAKSREV